MYALETRSTWLDIDLLLEGRRASLAWLARIKKVMPDLRVETAWIEMDEESSEGKVYSWFSGTQSEPLLPMYPVNELIKGQICDSRAFDRDGKILREDSQLSFQNRLGLQPSVIHWLEQ